MKFPLQLVLFFILPLTVPIPSLYAIPVLPDAEYSINNLGPFATPFSYSYDVSNTAYEHVYTALVSGSSKPAADLQGSVQCFDCFYSPLLIATASERFTI